MPFLQTYIRHPRENEPGAIIRYRPGLPIAAETLGDALAIAADYFAVCIIPHDERDWFRMYGIPGAGGDHTIVGIVIFRGTERICVNQDLSFPLIIHWSQRRLALWVSRLTSWLRRGSVGG
jgi:hypothetical protein